MSRHRPAALRRASGAQPPWSSRSLDRGVEQCGAAFRARNAFSACGWSGFRPTASRGSGVRPASTPLVVFGKRGNLDLLVAVDAAAERLGLDAGLALAQARAMHPALAAVPEDQAADARLLDAIADWCQRYTPLVAVDPPDGILLDIGGCAHLFGGEERLRDDLLARVTSFGFRRAPPSPRPSARPGPRHVSAKPAHHRATGDERELLWRRCRSPRCGCRPRWSPRWRASASNASATSSICRARRSPPASAPISCASSTARSAAKTSRSARACRSRPMSPRRAFPSRSRARRTCSRPSSGWRRGSKTALARARRRRAAPRARALPHRRRGQAHRRRHLAAGARSAGDPRAVRRAARRARRRDRSRASASIWRGFRCSSPSPARTSRSVSAATRIRPSSTAWSIA